MEATENKQLSPLKLNVKRTMIIGFAFFGILLLWQVYDSWCPKFLEQLFMEALHKQNNEEVQYLVGIMMALDNLAALILMPIFGRLSDKTRTKLGKRMPYILIGTFVCAVSFPFIPVFFHYH
ncbi:MAG: MFS transporter, partial [Candidatus Enteromonas sp.]|nr:MFS transporter [Candidatus Enteromonas sp.]